MTKEDARHIALGRRAAILPARRIEASLRICHRLVASAAWRRSGSVLAYAPIRDEVDVFPIARAALQAGKRLFLPRVVASGLMVAAPVFDLGDLLPGFMGILEPPGELSAAAACDLVVVPGAAFSADGCRIGYGRGHYDRFLWRFTCRLTVGVLFGEQFFDRLPSEPTDIRMNHLIVDGTWVACRRPTDSSR